MKTAIVFMNESMNHSFNWFVQKQWFIQEGNVTTVYCSHPYRLGTFHSVVKTIYTRDDNYNSKVLIIVLILWE